MSATKEKTTKPASERSEAVDAAEMANEAKRKPRKWWPLVFAPYLVGVIWHCLHPVASVFTGDFSNPRRSYIDENSLDPNHFKRDIQYQLMKPHQRQLSQAVDSSLCNALQSGTHIQNMIHCTKRGDLEITKIVPTGTAIAPVNEASVVILPATSSWLTSQLHFSVLQLITRLSSPDKTPWLAKTVFVVAPTSTNITLHRVVDTFLDAERSSTAIGLAQGAIIRNLLVLDVTSQSTAGRSEASPEIRILPQGRRGILPNMDLVFLCTNVYSRGLFAKIAMCPYPTTSWLSEQLLAILPTSTQSYLGKLFELLSFEYSLLAGPSMPHASALDRGIDSLTIRLVASDNKKRDDAAAAKVVSGLEYILRALSNLHERLHHSTSLYLLTSSKAFVKHEEYLVPNLLVIVPCIVRAVTLIFMDIQRFSWSTAARTFLFVSCCTLVISMVGLPLFLGDEFETSPQSQYPRSEWWLASSHNYSSAALLGSLLMPVGFFVPWRRGEAEDDRLSNATDRILTLQFLACLLVIYTHVAIAFSHVSQAFPSALIWSFLIAFPRYDALHMMARYALLALAGLAFVVLHPAGIDSSGCLYIRYIFLPLFWLLSLLVFEKHT